MSRTEQSLPPLFIEDVIAFLESLPPQVFFLEGKAAMVELVVDLRYLLGLGEEDNELLVLLESAKTTFELGFLESSLAFLMEMARVESESNSFLEDITIRDLDEHFLLRFADLLKGLFAFQKQAEVVMHLTSIFAFSDGFEFLLKVLSRVPDLKFYCQSVLENHAEFLDLREKFSLASRLRTALAVTPEVVTDETDAWTDCDFALNDLTPTWSEHSFSQVECVILQATARFENVKSEVLPQMVQLFWYLQREVSETKEWQSRVLGREVFSQFIKAVLDEKNPESGGAEIARVEVAQKKLEEYMRYVSINQKLVWAAQIWRAFLENAAIPEGV